MHACYIHVNISCYTFLKHGASNILLDRYIKLYVAIASLLNCDQWVYIGI